MILMILKVSAETSSAQYNTGIVMKNEHRLQPWSENPRYWQYKGEPLLIIGGSDDHNLFQWKSDELIPHLDLLTESGGNYIRNTMSDRGDGNIRAFIMDHEGKYDLDMWNDEYWTRFENMLKWSSERDIIVQVEVWDRFDYSDPYWATCPWNPGLNINYSYKETGFDEEYPRHPWADRQPFFHTIPGMPRYYPGLDIIRRYQEKFVSKMLSYSLNYGNVLYCMSNETSTPAAWGQYWINFIRSKAAENGVIVFATDMFDDGHKGEEAVHTAVIFQDTTHYMFAELSQVNSRNFDDEHWTTLIWLMEQVFLNKPRPVNHTKIYGGGYKDFGTGGQEDGVERFWRNILAGSASSRFHRPASGNGLNERATACIKAARELENIIKFWDIEPHMELLSDREPNEAYLAAKPGEQYALYFTHGGSVGLDLSGVNGTFRLKWISITEGILFEEANVWFPEVTIQGGSVVSITAPFKGGWVAAITRD